MKEGCAVVICGRVNRRVFSRSNAKELLKHKPLTFFDGRLFVKVLTHPLR